LKIADIDAAGFWNALHVIQKVAAVGEELREAVDWSVSATPAA
jgi:hypothetical protein